MPAKKSPAYTDLIGEYGVLKADARVRAIGAVDEASAALSLAKAFTTDDTTRALLTQSQKDLSLVMTLLALVSERQDFRAVKLSELDSALVALEQELTELRATVAMPKAFILSGETIASGALNFARASVRRAEREVVGLAQTEDYIPQNLIQYLNRLSSLCFMLDLAENSRLAFH